MRDRGRLRSARPGVRPGKQTARHTTVQREAAATLHNLTPLHARPPACVCVCYTCLCSAREPQGPAQLRPGKKGGGRGDAADEKGGERRNNCK